MGVLKAFLLLGLLMALADTGFTATKGFMPKAFEGEFTQVQKSRNPRKKSKEIPTKIYYQKPRNLHMHVEYGAGQFTKYICNKETTWFYTPPFTKEAKGQLKTGDSSKFCYAKIFDALNKGLKTNKIYTVKQLEHRKYQLTFSKEAAAEIQFDKVELTFDDMPLNFRNIGSITMYSPSKKQPVVLKRNSVDIKNTLDSDLFNFKAPANTETEVMK